jgi:hypothetical protein
MNDLEERISETLRERAPVFTTRMPEGTTARVRLRKGITTITAVTAIAGVVVLAVGALAVVPGVQRPAGQQTVPAPSGALPSLQGQEGGADDATAVKSEPTATEDTSAHGTISTEPYTEQVNGQEVYLLTQKHVVAAGHVSGIEWSLAGYETRAYSGSAFPTFLGGSCGDLMVGDQGEYGGISFCLHTDETADDAAFAMAGFGNDLDPNTGPIIGYAGLVTDRVASVELRLADGTTRALPLYDARSGIKARYFEVFVKAGADGRVVAVGSGGAEVDSGRLCITEPPDGSTNIGCGHGLVQVSSVVTGGPGEPAH